MIIAEIGLNHLGDLDQTNYYVDNLIKSDIDAITFQVREFEFYQSEEKSQLLLTNDNYVYLCNKIKLNDKKFGIAIADVNKIDFFESIKTDFYKVIRNDITDKKLIKRLIKTDKPLIVSTGISSEEEIKNFLNEFGNKNITINHTQLSYSPMDCNLSAINMLKQKYGFPVSYGSHCENENVLYMSLCYNPSDILFYVKGNFSSPNFYPDDKHAIRINHVKDVVDNLISLKNSIGTGVKEKTFIKIK